MLTTLAATIIGMTLLATLKPTARQVEIARLQATARGQEPRAA